MTTLSQSVAIMSLEHNNKQPNKHWRWELRRGKWREKEGGRQPVCAWLVGSTAFCPTRAGASHL